MKRGHLIEKVRIDVLQARLKEFRTDNQRHRAADKKHDETGNQIQSANIFMVGCCHPPHKSLGGTMVMMLMGMAMGLGFVMSCN